MDCMKGDKRRVVKKMKCLRQSFFDLVVGGVGLVLVLRKYFRILDLIQAGGKWCWVVRVLKNWRV